MRRVWPALVLGVLSVFLLPSPALAWVEWLAELSGPKGLKGEQFEARLVCFGDRLPQGLSVLISDASTRFADARIRRTDEAWRDSAEKWKEAAIAWNRVAVGLGALTADRVIANQAKAATMEPGAAAIQGQPARTWETAANAWKTAASQAMRAVDSTMVSTSSTNVMWSFCPSDKKRHVAIDLGVALLKTDDTRFADGKGLKLTTVIPSVSWRVFSDTRYDVVDVGTGGGMYWFSSEGFSSFSGVILQPWRVDLHAPSSWSGRPFSDPRRWAAIVVPELRVGQMLFPAGFNPSAFDGPHVPATPGIAAHWVGTHSIFFNLQPLIPRSRD